jgi:DNA helicase-2/ATP-dependent DNA helicase PcrA
VVKSPREHTISRSVIVAPAGCGKTEYIANAVNDESISGRKLVLTHTHAGVRSLRKRLKKKNVPSSAFRVETIDSFALRYAKAYPAKSELKILEPKTSQDYLEIIGCATKLFCSELAKNILHQSYTKVFVDEYQDCSTEQHGMILELSKILPCVITGDPLQGIFSFGDSPAVDWDSQVFPLFEKQPSLDTPWRWENEGNSKLGQWLLKDARPTIEAGLSLCLTGLESRGVYFHISKDDAYPTGLREQASEFETVFGISASGNKARPHALAENLRNQYRTIEPVTSEELFKLAAQIDSLSGEPLLDRILEFSDACLTKIKADCKDVRNNPARKFRNEKKTELKKLFEIIGSQGSYGDILKLFYFLETYKPTYKRWQLWIEMKKSLELAVSEGMNISEAVLQIKNRTRFQENLLPRKCLSRPVLLKGLECECAIVIDAHKFATKEDFYVAITRGSKALHIYSSSPCFPPSIPNCPNCGKKMALRDGTYGVFWGCSGYPACRGVLNLDGK